MILSLKSYPSDRGTFLYISKSSITHRMSDIFPIEVDGLLLTKAVISIGIVVALSLIAERVGPRAAGLLTGLPLGGGMVIIFTGAEQGTAFATEAAAHMVPGFVTTLTFIYLYGIVSVCQQLGGIKAIGMPLLVANLGYVIVAWLVSIISLGVLISIPLVIVGMILTSRAMINLPNTPILARVRFGWRVLMFRAGMATSTILLITAIAGNIGAQWTGILTAYPMTLLPLILVIHITYSGNEIAAVLKHVPMGLGGVISFCISATYSLPALGLGWGTAFAYLVAFTYLLGYSTLSQLWRKNKAI